MTGLIRGFIIFAIFVIFAISHVESGVDTLARQDLIDHLKYQQDTRNTFDSRIRQGDYMKPIGYVAGKPIWPRVLERVRTTGELFFDDDNIAYVVHDRNAAGMVRKMDREKNYNTVMNFLEKYT